MIPSSSRRSPHPHHHLQELENHEGSPPECDFFPISFSYLTTTKPISPKIAPSYESLKLTARKEQLCLLNKHLALHQLGLTSGCAPSDGDSSFHRQLLRATDGDGRTRPRDDWDDRAALLKLPAAVVYVRDQHLEGKLHLLKHHERLQHLEQQRSHRVRVDGEPKAVSKERPLSPCLSITVGCKEERMEDAEDGKVERELWLSRDGSEHRGKAESLRDYGVDAPLDLSDTGRGKGMGWIKHQEANSPRLSPGDSPMHGPCRRHGMERDSSQPHSCWHDAAQTQLTGQPGAIKEEEEEEEEETAVVSTAQVGITPTPSLLLEFWCSVPVSFKSQRPILKWPGNWWFCHVFGNGVFHPAQRKDVHQHLHPIPTGLGRGHAHPSTCCSH